jgi:hypothetical protein
MVAFAFFFFLYSLIVHVINELYFSVSAFAFLQEDPVLLAPETKEQKPDIVIIKVIAWNCFVVCHRLLIDPLFLFVDPSGGHALMPFIFKLDICTFFSFSLCSSYLLLMLNKLVLKHKHDSLFVGMKRFFELLLFCINIAIHALLACSDVFNK